ncbi:hypothetical protein SAMN06269301_1093 [Geobacter sp. DSM 9736]|nr:hypothetical protein SAMN06269301_1093 [Geobacter sp. DSM 9736]
MDEHREPVLKPHQVTFSVPKVKSSRERKNFPAYSPARRQLKLKNRLPHCKESGGDVQQQRVIQSVFLCSFENRIELRCPFS